MKIILHLLLILLPATALSQNFNQFQLELKNYEIRYDDNIISINSDFKLSDSYYKDGNKITVYEFGLKFSDITHSKQVMIIEYDSPINIGNELKMLEFLRPIIYGLENEGMTVRNSLRAGRRILFYDKKTEADRNLFIRGRVTIHRNKLYFISSELYGDISESLAFKWQETFFGSTFVNRFALNEVPKFMWD